MRIQNGVDIKIDKSSFERVEQFKNLVTTLTNQNSKNLKIKIQRTITFLVVLYGCKTWLLTWREERRLRVCEEKI